MQRTIFNDRTQSLHLSPRLRCYPTRIGSIRVLERWGRSRWRWNVCMSAIADVLDTSTRRRLGHERAFHQRTIVRPYHEEISPSADRKFA